MPAAPAVLPQPGLRYDATAEFSVISYCPCRRRRVGNTIHLYGKGSFPFGCVIGPDFLCNLAAWILLLGISAAFLALAAYSLHVYVFVAHCCTLAAVSGAFLVTTLSDPGYLPRLTLLDVTATAEEGRMAGVCRTNSATSAAMATTTLQLGENNFGESSPRRGSDTDSTTASLTTATATGFTTCSVCHVQRERGAAHCYDCARCVLELDHHCPYSSKCIGKGNIKAFGVFLSLLGIHSLFTALGFIAWIITQRISP